VPFRLVLTSLSRATSTECSSMSSESRFQFVVASRAGGDPNPMFQTSTVRPGEGLLSPMALTLAASTLARSLA
jgi:hypothetical protein